METTKRSFMYGALVSGLAASFAVPVHAQSVAPSEAQQIAIDAYVYGYSLITTEVTRVQGSNVAKSEGMHAPTNQFANVPRYPPADFRLVSAPNADTLYSLAWLDLSEPQVFSHPDMGNRFYLFEMVDLWMSDLRVITEQTHSRRKGRQLPDHRTGLEGHGTGRDEADPNCHTLYGHSRADLCGRNGTGLQGRQCAADPVQDHTALRMGQAVYP